MLRSGPGRDKSCNGSDQAPSAQLGDRHLSCARASAALRRQGVAHRQTAAPGDLKGTAGVQAPCGSRPAQFQAKVDLVNDRVVFGSKLSLALLLGSAAWTPLLAAQQTGQQTGTPPPTQNPAQPAATPAPPAPGGAGADDEEDSEGPAIVITGTRERGAVISDIPPENQLNRRDIRATGAGSLQELLNVISPQTQSGRGRGGEAPVLLLNGQRISSFGEIRDIPPEAIDRLDILPEEVALRYGYSADQRVVNIVTRRRFRAVTTELNGGVATEGGRANYGAEFTFLRIQDGGRFNLHAEYNHAGSLLESEGDLTQSPPSSPFSLGGNVGASPFGGEIDPALSALAGRPVTVAAVPASAAAGA